MHLKKQTLLFSQLLFTAKLVLNGHSKIDKTKALKTDYHIMQVKSIAEHPHLEHLQYFWSALTTKTCVVGTEKSRLNEIFFEHPKHMFKLIDKKMITTFLCFNFLTIWTYANQWHKEEEIQKQSNRGKERYTNQCVTEK